MTRERCFALNDPTLEPLFKQAFTALDPSAANDIYNEIDLQLWRDLPTIPLLQMPVTTVTNNALQGLTPSQAPASFMSDAQNWSWELNAPPTVTTSTLPTQLVPRCRRDWRKVLARYVG